MLGPWKKSYDQPRQFVKKQRHYFTNKGPSSQNYGFSRSHAWMWELAHKESWVLKNWCFWTVVLEKTLESTLDCKEIKPVIPKGNQSWIFIGRTDTKAETPIFWPPDVKNWLTGKDPDAGKDWRREEKGMTEDEMVGWHHRLNGYEFEQVSGLGDGQGGLVCCSPRGHRVWHDWATGLDWAEFMTFMIWCIKYAPSKLHVLKREGAPQAAAFLFAIDHTWTKRDQCTRNSEIQYSCYTVSIHTRWGDLGVRMGVYFRPRPLWTSQPALSVFLRCESSGSGVRLSESRPWFFLYWMWYLEPAMSLFWVLVSSATHGYITNTYLISTS